MIEPLRCEERGNDVLIDLKVTPKSSKNEIRGLIGGALKISVTAPPDKGQANAAVRKLLSKVLKTPPSSIEIVAGQTSRSKRVQIRGLSCAELTERI